MKSNRLFSLRNRVLSYARFATVGTLFIAAAATAFVAVKTSTPTSHAKISMSAFRARQEALETSLGATRSGEPDPSAKGADVSNKISNIHNHRAQPRYDDQAYPMQFIDSAYKSLPANAACPIPTPTARLPG